MGTCCGKNERTTEEYDKNKPYVDITLHDEHKISLDFSVSKAREKMGVETICEGKLTHDKELKHTSHPFEDNLANPIPKVVDLVLEE